MIEREPASPGRWPAHLSGERGAIGSVQAVVVLPLVMLFFMGAVESALFYYGRAAAISIAHTGAVAAATEHGTESACESAAAELAARIGDALSGLQISCQRTATTATATVTGDVLSVVPGWRATVTQSADVPVERLT